MKRVADLLVVVGPSGVGKSTLISRLMEEFPDKFGYSVSHTTRSIRQGEVDGKSYHFVAPETFKELIEKKQFIEHAIVHDTMYGTSEGAIQAVLALDQVCMMDLDIKGACALQQHPTLRSVVVFIRPPTFEELARRLRGRGTETEERITKRLQSAVDELAWHDQHQTFFDASLLNDNFEECYQNFVHEVMERAFSFSNAPPLHSR